MKAFISLISSFYVGIAAMVMTWQTLHSFAPTVLHSSFIILFSGTTTFTAYIGYWYLIPSPIKKLQQLLFIAGAICACLVWLFYIRDFVWTGISLILTIFYTAPLLITFNWIRKIHWGKSLLLAFIWTYSTTLLPLKLLHVNIHANLMLFAVSRYAMILVLCILFDLRDLEQDQRNGTRNFLHYLHAKQIPILVYMALALFFISSIGLSKTLYNPLEYFIWLLPGIIMGIIFPFIRKSFSIWFYYLFIDGFMMLSGLLMFLVRF